MKPVFQTKFSSRDRSTRGNCLAACVASLLEISIEHVPEWEEMDKEWGDSFISFLEEKGIDFNGTFTMSGAAHSWQWLIDNGYQGIDGHYIVCGKSPRFPQIDHAVIYRYGEMVHDPHPSAQGLYQVDYLYLLEKPKVVAHPVTGAVNRNRG